jgi:SNF2 family DNA or RNA helicase
MDSMFARVKQHLRTELIEPYQPQGIQWMLQRETTPMRLFEENMPFGGIVADEVGLGKTILSIGVMLGNYLPRTLIILPKSLICQWEAQINTFCDNLTVHVIRKSSDTIQLFDHEQGHVYLISQSLLNLRNSVVGSSVVHNVHWNRIIVDEAHMLRNCKSKLYESCALLKSDIRWALTATPVMNRMIDYVNIMNWIGVSKFLCQGEKDAVTNTFILRRTKADVKSYNPSLAMSECVVEIKNIPFQSYDEADIYFKVFNKERRQIQTKVKTTTTDLLEHLLRIRQVCIHPQLYIDGILRKKQKLDIDTRWERDTTKIKALMQCLREQPKDDKTLIFCQFVREMDIYEQVLNESEFNCVRLDGNMSLTERDQAVRTFSTDPNVHVFLIQINTGGQGINLQAANRIYIMSPNWNPAMEHQAIGRAHRTGQTKTVFVTKFCITSGDAQMPFIEENILKLQDKKKDIIANILNDHRIKEEIAQNHMLCDSAGSLSAREIRALFNIHQMKD